MYISTQNSSFNAGFGVGVSILGNDKKENFENYNMNVPQPLVGPDESCMNQTIADPLGFDYGSYDLFPLEKL